MELSLYCLSYDMAHGGKDTDMFELDVLLLLDPADGSITVLQNVSLASTRLYGSITQKIVLLTVMLSARQIKHKRI